MSQTIIIAVSVSILNLLVLRWAFREEVYGQSVVKSLVRVPCLALIILIPLGALFHLADIGALS